MCHGTRPACRPRSRWQIIPGQAGTGTVKTLHTPRGGGGGGAPTPAAGVLARTGTTKRQSKILQKQAQLPHNCLKFRSKFKIPKGLGARQ